MSTPSINSSTATGSSSTQSEASLRVPQQTLNQDDFLKLLIAQLSSQDPMNPVSNTEFIGQMAQFSTLQQTQNMQTDMAGLKADSLLGKTVQVQPSQGLPVTGVVSAISIKAGTPSIVVNGQLYDLSQVLGVALAPTQS